MKPRGDDMRPGPDSPVRALTALEGEVLIRTTASLALPRDDLPAGRGGVPTSAAGVVVGLGSGLETRFRVGQRVAFADTRPPAGLHRVPGALVAPVPDDANDEEACFGAVAALALQAIGTLGVGLGDFVAVLADGVAGLLAVELLDLSGARAIAIDRHAKCRELARFVGAELTLNPDDGDPARAVRERTAGLGCDGVLVAMSEAAPRDLALAAAIARDGACISLMAGSVADIPAAPFAGRPLRLRFPGGFSADSATSDGARRNFARCFADVVRLMTRRRDRRLHVEQFITHRIDGGGATDPAAGDTDEFCLGVVRRHPAPPRERLSGLRIPAHVSPAAGDTPRGCRLAAVGAGPAARRALAPYLSVAKDFLLSGAVDPHGDGATDVAATLENPDIDAVIVAAEDGGETVARALRAGKHVLALPPPARGGEGVDALVRARNRAASFLQVAHPWRFAPVVRRASDILAAHPGARTVLIRAATELPAAAAVSHSVDLARFLIGAGIATVSAGAVATSGGERADVAATLQFRDGSLATIAVTESDAGVLVECTGAGTAIRIDDFRTLTATIDAAARSVDSAPARDCGHAALIDEFVRAVRAGGPAPVSEIEQIESVRAAIAVFESLRAGSPITL